MVDPNPQTRLRILAVVFLLGLLILWGRLFELQILRNREFRQKSEANSIRMIEELPGRGIICDRYGRIIAESRPSYTISLIPYEARRSASTLPELAAILNVPLADLEASIPYRGIQAYLPYKFIRDAEFETLAAYRARALDLAGVSTQFEPKRHYLFPVAPHTLGYISEISETEIKRFPQRKSGDIVGKQGIERAYENLLAGKKGYHYMIVNALGQITGELAEEYIKPRCSGKLYLTLDLDLQLLAEELMLDKRGALVALDPRNGEILAIVSAPKFDLEVFAGVLRSDDWRKLQSDPDVPLLNRTIQAGYPAASTFKMVTLTAALEEGIINSSYRYHCSGEYYLGRVFHCYKKEGHGTIGCLESIEQSCDAFFYRLGHRLGADRLGTYAKRYGFGSPTGIDIENEISGIAPDKKYLDKKHGVGKWSPALALNVAIGQGETLVTPLQLAQYCGIIATGGVKAKPHLFLEMYQSDGGLLQYQPETERVNISSETLGFIRAAMLRVVEGDRGTARGSRDPRWHIAGKTGTAQNPHGDDHSLFIGFGTFEDPRIAIAVVVENAGFGSVVAAPIATQIIYRYLELTQFPENPEYRDPNLTSPVALASPLQNYDQDAAQE